MSDIIGVIYPVPKKFVDRLMVKNRTVFVKYLGGRATNPKIFPNHKLVFYASHDAKELVGEAKIKSVELLTPIEVLDKYGNRVFLDKVELMNYATQRGRTLSKKLLVLTLCAIKPYSPPIKWTESMTMAGKYLREQEYRELVKRE